MFSLVFWTKNWNPIFFRIDSSYSLKPEFWLLRIFFSFFHETCSIVRERERDRKSEMDEKKKMREGEGERAGFHLPAAI